MRRFVELKDAKSKLDQQSKLLGTEMDRLKALIVADMGGSCSAAYEDESGSHTVTFNPSYRESIAKKDLFRLKDAHPDIYKQYVTSSESRAFKVKYAAAKAA